MSLKFRVSAYRQITTVIEYISPPSNNNSNSRTYSATQQNDIIDAFCATSINNPRKVRTTLGKSITGNCFFWITSSRLHAELVFVALQNRLLDTRLPLHR